jgi:hypothetical protein
MLGGFRAPHMLPGISYSYTPEDYTSVKTLYVQQFNGKDWIISDKPVSE